MSDLNRPALLIALVLLFVVFTSMGPGLFFGLGISETLRWVLFGGLIYLLLSRGGCCGRRRACYPDPDSEPA